MSYRVKPFVGERYCAQDVKILVVGESHYSSNANELNEGVGLFNLTNEIVKDLALGENKHIFFETIEKFLRTNAGIKDFQDIAFMNFVEEVMLKDKDGKIETVKEHQISPNNGKFFFEKVRRLRPDVVVFFSAYSYNQVPDPQNSSHKEIYDFEGIEYNKNKSDYLHEGWCKYIIDNKDVDMFKIPHPTGSWSKPKFESYINEFKDDTWKIKKKWNKVFN